jgi:hypothetical protein
MISSPRIAVGVLGCLALVACSGSKERADGGVVGARDAAPSDSGRPADDDAGAPADASDLGDAVAPADANEPQDGGAEADASDASPLGDASPRADASAVPDAGTSNDASPATDASPRADGSAPPDAASSNDASAPLDATIADSGQADAATSGSCPQTCCNVFPAYASVPGCMTVVSSCDSTIEPACGANGGTNLDCCFGGDGRSPYDGDRDGFLTCASACGVTIASCQPGGTPCDCDDNDINVYPGHGCP